MTIYCIFVPTRSLSKNILGMIPFLLTALNIFMIEIIFKFRLNDSNTAGMPGEPIKIFNVMHHELKRWKLIREWKRTIT